MITFTPPDAPSQLVNAELEQTVLDSLLNANITIPYGCKIGACQSCKLQAIKGQIPPESQTGLTNAEKQLGYFLSCVCHPKGPLSVTLGDAAKKVTATVIGLDKLSANVMRLRLSPAIHFLPGQYVTIWHNEKYPRSYSIASTEEEGFIECHIKKIEGGIFSTFVFENLNIGDPLKLQGPMGSCIYAPNDNNQPLLLAGIGTGIAPLFGIAKEAIAQQHQGPIHFVCAAKNASHFYLQEELLTLRQQHNSFRITYISQQAPATLKHNPFEEVCGDIYHYCKSTHPSTKNYSVYLCGAQSFVTKLKKQCFLTGTTMSNIYMDAFLPCS